MKKRIAKKVTVVPEPMMKMIKEPLPMKTYLHYPDAIYKYPPRY